MWIRSHGKTRVIVENGSVLRENYPIATLSTTNSPRTALGLSSDRRGVRIRDSYCGTEADRIHWDSYCGTEVNRIHWDSYCGTEVNRIHWDGYCGTEVDRIHWDSYCGTEVNRINWDSYCGTEVNRIHWDGYCQVGLLKPSPFS
jgi:hypothetical protein